jgi:hypothetical protein
MRLRVWRDVPLAGAILRPLGFTRGGEPVEPQAPFGSNLRVKDRMISSIAPILGMVG